MSSISPQLKLHIKQLNPCLLTVYDIKFISNINKLRVRVHHKMQPLEMEVKGTSIRTAMNII